MEKQRRREDNLCPWSQSRKTTKPGPDRYLAPDMITCGGGGLPRVRGEAILHSAKNSLFWACLCHALCTPGHVPSLLGLCDPQPHKYRAGLGVFKCPSSSGLPESWYPGCWGLEPIPNGHTKSSLLTKSAKFPARHIYFCPAGFINMWARELASVALERLKSWL